MECSTPPALFKNDAASCRLLASSDFRATIGCRDGFRWRSAAILRCFAIITGDYIAVIERRSITFYGRRRFRRLDSLHGLD